MVFNTISVGTAVAPNVIETCFSHYLNRKPLCEKPTAHISYHQSLNLIRQFMHHASFHTVEEIQNFTSQGVPSPHWVKVEEVIIPVKSISEAAAFLIAQLGHKGIDKVGGSKWWQWRRENSLLEAEWIEMRAHYAKRKERGDKGKRVMMYVHGGAYFFGSVDEHRYQMQRHARKLEARVFARSRYRLAPQFPFPCGLHDCLSAYLYLLTIQDASTIVLAGDSAGGGMIMSILIILRDQGIPLPAGAILISPWVDLTHSFPSLCEDASLDYIPVHGFLQRPSNSWPPPNSEDMEQMAMHAVENIVGKGMARKTSREVRRQTIQEAIQGFSVDKNPQNLNPVENKNNPAGTRDAGMRPGNTIPGTGHNLSIMIDGQLVEIKDQIQMYATNQLISHPLVSPVLQPSLGGLPPLLVLTGGGELLRDEQIYLAHKAANPSKYPPGEAYLDEYLDARDLVSKWAPTDVQLQVWDDLCHVAPTLSFTRPAKYMYRSISQFGAWALARAQSTSIEILDDDKVSVISSESDSGGNGDENPTTERLTRQDGIPQGRAATEQVGKAGKPLPPFRNHMIRQRVDRHGNIYPLGPPSSLPGLQVPPNEIGVIKPGPVRQWMEASKQWSAKFAKEKRKVQNKRVKEMAKGFEGFGDDEVPPPSALAGRRSRNALEERERKKGRSWGMSLWSLWGSSHDEKTIEREEKADKEVETSNATEYDGANASPVNPRKAKSHSRSRSFRRSVTDTGQTTSFMNEETTIADLMRLQNEDNSKQDGNAKFSDDSEVPSPAINVAHDDKKIVANTSKPPSNRPTAGAVAFPFKLGTHLQDDNANASTITLKSHAGVSSPKGNEPTEKGGIRFPAGESSTKPEEADRSSANSHTRNSDESQTQVESPMEKRPDMERFVTASEGLS